MRPVRRGLKLELTQAHMAQKPVLRVEVGARALRVRSVSREGTWASAGVQDAWVSGCGCEADWGVLWSQRPSVGPAAEAQFAAHTQPALRTGLMAPAWRLLHVSRRVILDLTCDH